MKLTTKGRYAVMAMVDLAVAKTDKPVALAEIAERQEISLSYLEQLFAKLRRGGLVQSVRGPGGGYMLRIPPEAIRVSDIVLAVDDPLRAPRARSEKITEAGMQQSHRLTQDLWDELGNQIHLYLSSLTLDDVINRRVIGTSRMYGLQETAAMAAE